MDLFIDTRVRGRNNNRETCDPDTFNFPKTWEKYAGETLEYVYEVEPDYLRHLIMRKERPLRGILRTKINAFLDTVE